MEIVLKSGFLFLSNLGGSFLENKKIRIQKVIADRGFTSRRKAEELIKNGLVKVNGKVVNLGDKVLPNEKIYVNGKEVINQDKKHYIMLNKPRGYVSTVSDELNRKCVLDLVSDVKERIYPIGRLDKDSEGLLLLTNDGNFMNSILHPSKHVEKVYKVTVKPKISEKQLTDLCVGVKIDGFLYVPFKVNILKEKYDRSVLEITLKEGKNRQIRKMCEAVGLKVAKLKRVSIGGLKLGMLKIGEYRELTSEERKNILR